MDNTDCQSEESLSGRLEKMFELGLYTDCKFSFGGDTIIEASRAVLAAASPVFAAMFFGPNASNESPIEIEDIQPCAFELMIRYIYSDKAHPNSVTEAFDLYYAANKYIIASLLKVCVTYILKEVRPENVCQTLEFAKLHERNQIMEECYKIIKEETYDVLSSPSFLEADISTLETILTMEQLCVLREMDLLDACVRWSIAKCEKDNLKLTASNKRNALQKVLPLIRFLAMNLEEFVKAHETSKILTEVESYKILSSLVSQKSSMPSNLCTYTGPRCNRPPLSCEIGTYSKASTAWQKNNTSTLVFRFSVVVRIEGIRLLKQGISNPVVNEWSISDEAGQVLHRGFNPIKTVSSVSRDYIFGNRVHIQPDHIYKLHLEFDADNSLHWYQIQKSENTLEKERNICGYCYSDSMIYGTVNSDYISFSQILYSLS